MMVQLTLFTERDRTAPVRRDEHAAEPLGEILGRLLQKYRIPPKQATVGPVRSETRRHRRAEVCEV